MTVYNTSRVVKADILRDTCNYWRDISSCFRQRRSSFVYERPRSLLGKPSIPYTDDPVAIMTAKIIDLSAAITMEHRSVKTIYCTGTPYEIGRTHGTLAAHEIHNNVTTYTFFFKETAKITWAQARERAATQLRISSRSMSEVRSRSRTTLTAAPAYHNLTVSPLPFSWPKTGIGLKNYIKGSYFYTSSPSLPLPIRRSPKK